MGYILYTAAYLAVVEVGVSPISTSSLLLRMTAFVGFDLAVKTGDGCIFCCARESGRIGRQDF